MTHYSLAMGEWTIISTTVVQGMGFGLVWVPLTAVSFATLPTKLRTEASAFSALVRNIGGSLGIAIGENVLVRAIQTSHASIAAHATPYNPMLQSPRVQHLWNLHTLARPHHAQRRDHAAGGDDRLYRRVQAVDGGDVRD